MGQGTETDLSGRAGWWEAGERQSVVIGNPLLKLLPAKTPRRGKVSRVSLVLAHDSAAARTNTFAIIEKHWSHANDAIPLGEEVVEVMRLSWDEGGIPPVPESALKGLKAYVKSEKRQSRK